MNAMPGAALHATRRETPPASAQPPASPHA